MNIEKLIISQDKLIIDALFHLNNILRYQNISRLILFVIDEKKRVIGTITDGDIRRSLIKEKNLYIKLIDVCKKNFIFIYENKEFINLSLYRKKNIKVLPVLNKKKKLIKIFDLDLINSQIPIECIIMAGGRGKRLSPLTDNTPKPMLKLDDKPILEHILDRIKKFGINKIYLSVGYLGNQIKEYFGDGYKKGLNIKYINERKPLGTAGSLSLIYDKIKTKHILIINADIFSNVNLEKMYLELLNNKSDMVIATKEYKVDIPYGIFENIDKKIISIKEKPSYSYNTNAGIYILNKKKIKLIPKNSFFDMTDLIEKMLKNDDKITHYSIYGFWTDIGSPSQFKKAQNLIRTINS